MYVFTPIISRVEKESRSVALRFGMFESEMQQVLELRAGIPPVRAIVGCKSCQSPGSWVPNSVSSPARTKSALAEACPFGVWSKKKAAPNEEPPFDEPF